MSWQLLAVIAIEVIAILFLASRFRARERPRPPSKEPDVKVEGLLRKKKPDCH